MKVIKMKNFLVPDYSFKALTDVTPEFLCHHDIKLLMLDMDNTISPYGIYEPSEDILAWSDNMKSAGIELYIVSNSKRPGRTEQFAKIMNIGYIKAAGKPKPAALLKVMGIKNISPKNCALAGDQIYTDTIAANLAGVMSILVFPIKFTNVFLKIRYWAELPFRALCKNKMEG